MEGMNLKEMCGRRDQPQQSLAVLKHTNMSTGGKDGACTCTYACVVVGNQEADEDAEGPWWYRERKCSWLGLLLALIRDFHEAWDAVEMSSALHILKDILQREEQAM